MIFVNLNDWLKSVFKDVIESTIFEISKINDILDVSKINDDFLFKFLLNRLRKK